MPAVMFYLTFLGSAHLGNGETTRWSQSTTSNDRVHTTASKGDLQIKVAGIWYSSHSQSFTFVRYDKELTSLKSETSDAVTPTSPGP